MIVQSKATAHVYRIFGALVALLVMMALAVGLMRMRADRGPASPYGALAVASSPATQAPAAVAAIAPREVTPPVVEKAPADPVAAQASPAPTSPPAAKAVPVTPPADLVAAPAAAPRQIALDKAAAASTLPQPAPPAVVAAAARAAAAPAQTASLPDEPTDEQAQAPVPPTRAAALAATSPGGHVNINTASVDTLNSIPGAGRIGRTIARHRPYRSLEDLVDRRVLKARDFARIKDALSIN